MKWFNFSIYLTLFKIVTSLKYNNFFRSIQQDNLSKFYTGNIPGIYPKITRPWNGDKLEALILEGGGARAVIYCGVVQCLKDHDLLSDIKYFAGSSSGAQVASLLAFGYNSTEMNDLFRLSPWNEILDRTFSFNFLKSIHQIVNEYGIYNGEKLEYFYDTLFENKIGISQCTFNQLYEKEQIHLRIGVCNVNIQDFIYLDYKSNPDMPISKAIRASSAIPLIFTATEWKNQVLIDGGIMGNLPTTAFLDKKCLACNLVSVDQSSIVEKKPENILNYIKRVFSMILVAAQHQYGPLDIEKKNIDIINIAAYNISLLETDISKDKFMKLIQEGYNSTKIYLSYYNNYLKDLSL